METPPSVLAFSEHWLHEDEVSSISINGYKMASCFTRSSFIHGGSCICVRADLKFEEISKLKQKSKELYLECSAVKIIEIHSIIVCIYTTSKRDTVKTKDFLKEFDCLLNDITDAYREYRIFICGDFNINLNKNSRETEEFMDIITANNLVHTITASTRVYKKGESLLDNILTNIKNYEAYNMIAGMSDHHAQVLETNIQTPNDDIIKKRNFSQRNILKFREALMEEDYREVYETTNAEESIKHLNHILHLHINSAFPEKMTKVNCYKNNQWITNGIKISCKNKKMLYQEKNLGLITDEHYKKYCYILKEIINLAKLNYNKKLVSNSINKQKAIWKIIKTNNDEHKNKTDIKILNKPNETIQETLNRFNNFYIDACKGTFNVKGNTRAEKRINHTIFLKPTTPSEIYNIIMGLNNTKSMGTDGIPVVLLKCTTDVLCEPISHICNICLENGQFPRQWKESTITPVHKKGNRTEFNNYRPIALISNMAKILEKVLLHRFYNFFDENKVITTSQNAYVKHGNTERAIFQMILEVLTGLNNPRGTNKVASLYIDLSKAFDSVNFDLLLEKLEILGIRGIPLEIIKSYVMERQQCIKIIDNKNNVHMSDYLEVKRGVPQGSILGPLLFIIYINSIPINVTAPVFLYADDTSAVCISDTDENLKASLNTTICQLKEWFDENYLTMNIEKTKLQVFRTTNNTESFSLDHDGYTILTSKESIKFLGVHIDETLKWKVHINELAKKISGYSYLLKSLKGKAELESCMTAYYGYVYAALKYGIVFWGNSVDVNRIFLLQKRCIRSMFSLDWRDSCKPYFRNYGILTLSGMYIVETALFLRKHKEFFESAQREHYYGTRFKDMYNPPQTRLTNFQNNIYNHSIKIYNHLPDEIKKLPERKFTTELKRFLQDKVYYSVGEFLK